MTCGPERPSAQGLRAFDRARQSRIRPLIRDAEDLSGDRLHVGCCRRPERSCHRGPGGPALDHDGLWVLKCQSVDRHPFEALVFPPLPAKPRSCALTSVLDKGLGPGQVRDLVSVASEWMDVVKLGWGSARLTGEKALREKIDVYKAADIAVCTGGTFFELALAQGKVDEFLEAARGLGIGMVEVSNGIHPMSEDDKLSLIRKVRTAGFRVWSEVGKKDPEEDARIGFGERIAAVERELEAGAEKVVLEARESGTVGIYDRSGNPALELIDRMAESVGFDNLVFEAPLKPQQVWMIRHFGSRVNLGNVPAAEAIPLATLRTGLRGDTFADFHLTGVDVYVSTGINGAMEAAERGGVVVLIDALRFSATVTTALASGMRSVKVVATAGECVGDVTAGERGGSKIAHLDHGNSPTELLEHDYRGRELVITSSNGAEVMLTASRGARHVLVGSTLNASAVASAALKLASAEDCPITLLEAGRNNRRAVEDALAAGEIFAAMRGVRLHGRALPTSSGLESDFFFSDSGKNLESLGYGADVRFCAQVDRYDVVPLLRGDTLMVQGDS